MTESALVLEHVAIGALQDVSLSVAGGEIVCLSGRSGAGKTRLLRAIADLDAHAGQISLSAQRQSDMSAHRWRSKVMMVPAESQWWEESVAAHFPCTPVRDLRSLGFDEQAMGWQVARLSSGERQRLALLRALARSPRALLLDEPTANLDVETMRRTEAWLIERCREGRLAVLWVAHDTRQIERIADRHFAIRDGKLEQVS